jgi:hypothetical protein
MKQLSNELSNKYNYKKLPENLSKNAQTIYIKALPAFLLLDTGQSLYTVNGSLICNGFDRIVTGDYGSYIEFSNEQANKDMFTIAPGQEYRLEPRYNNAKYIWLTIGDDSDVKIYYQRNTVSYADYQPKKYYVSVYEVYPEEIVILSQEEGRNELS